MDQQLVVKRWDNEDHFDKTYLETRRKLLSYGQVMTTRSYSKRKGSRIHPFTSQKAIVGCTKFSTLGELQSPSHMVHENSSFQEYERIRYFPVEEDEEEREIRLKATGYIAYCRQRALEEAEKTGSSPLYRGLSSGSADGDEVVPLASSHVSAGRRSACLALVTVTDDEEKSHGIKHKLAKAAAKVKMIGGLAVTSAKLLRSEFRKGFR
ncbi:hypothetical protein R1sor_008045 [Riccia sorocarpa]|uniref:Senescence domain-containing protein n=1 Tax=Riccia sorocarpa TaxID=122646 RepID=A0ABD3HVP8_9MARC